MSIIELLSTGAGYLEGSLSKETALSVAGASSLPPYATFTFSDSLSGPPRLLGFVRGLRLVHPQLLSASARRRPGSLDSVVPSWSCVSNRTHMLCNHKQYSAFCPFAFTASGDLPTGQGTASDLASHAVLSSTSSPHSWTVCRPALATSREVSQTRPPSLSLVHLARLFPLLSTLTFCPLAGFRRYLRRGFRATSSELKVKQSEATRRSPARTRKASSLRKRPLTPSGPSPTPQALDTPLSSARAMP